MKNILIVIIFLISTSTIHPAGTLLLMALDPQRNSIRFVTFEAPHRTTSDIDYTREINFILDITAAVSICPNLIRWGLPSLAAAIGWELQNHPLPLTNQQHQD